MNENELRIGNIVLVSNEQCHPQLKDVLMKVTSIQHRHDLPEYSVRIERVVKDKFDVNVDYGQLMRFIKPIPLTEELLCKCPIFHKSHNEQGNTFHVLKDGWDVLHTIEHWTETENPKYKGRFHWNGIGEVKYLHEVQNWYYMFMKKELEINL